MKAYKVTGGHYVDRYLFYYNFNTYLLATPVLPHQLVDKHNIPHLEKLGLLEESDLLAVKWLHPHLPKIIKKKVYESLES